MSRSVELKIIGWPAALPGQANTNVKYVKSNIYMYIFCWFKRILTYNLPELQRASTKSSFALRARFFVVAKNKDFN